MASGYELLNIAGDVGEAVTLLERALATACELLTDEEGKPVPWLTLSQTTERIDAALLVLRTAMVPVADEVARQRVDYDEQADKWEAQSRGGY